MEQWGGAVEDMVKEVELKEGIKEKINQLQVYADKNDNIIWLSLIHISEPTRPY